MIKTISYNTINNKFNPVSLGIIGAVHGNEKCGTQAINRIIAEIDSGLIVLEHGSLHLMPIANPKAYEQNVRFIERNLNRHLYPKNIADRVAYEDEIDPIICAFIDKSQVLLDLHSYSCEGEPFVFISGRSHTENMYAQALGLDYLIYGWQEAFGENSPNGIKEAQGTTEYARATNIHVKAAVTLECGNHLNPIGADIAYTAIINSLKFLGMLKKDPDNQPIKDRSPVFIRMQTVFNKKDGLELTKEYKHLDFITKGQIIAKDSENSANNIIAVEDCYIIMPKHNEQIEGNEWFYIGIKTDSPTIV
jgi:predicted deacylase